MSKATNTLVEDLASFSRLISGRFWRAEGRLVLDAKGNIVRRCRNYESARKVCERRFWQVHRAAIKAMNTLSEQRKDHHGTDHPLQLENLPDPNQPGT